jgi:hypothetical protein
VSALLDDLSTLSERRENEYAALIDRVLAGEVVAAEEIEMACLRAKRDPSLFASTVTRRQRRAAERERLKQIPLLDEEERSIIADVEAANQRLEDAVAAHRAETQPLQWRLSQLRDERTKLRASEAELAKGCGDATLNRRAKHLQQLLEGVHNRRSELQRNLRNQQAVLRQEAGGNVDRKTWIDRDANSAPLPASVPDTEPYAMFKNRVCRAQLELDRWDQQVAGWLAEQDDIRRQQFEW